MTPILFDPRQVMIAGRESGHTDFIKRGTDVKTLLKLQNEKNEKLQNYKIAKFQNLKIQNPKNMHFGCETG